MSKRFKTSVNYFVITDTVTSIEELRELKSNISYKDNDGDISFHDKSTGKQKSVNIYTITNAVNGDNGDAAFSDLVEMKNYLDSNTGKNTKNINPLTAFGDLRTAELSPQFQGSFEYTVDNTDLVEKTLTNGGTATQASGMGVVTTTTTTASMAMISSKQHAKYRAGLGGVLRFTALFTPGVADTEQYIGLIDEHGSSAAFKNGFSIGYDGVTFGYHRFQNDTKITTAIASWDDPLDGSGESGETIDQTKLNVFFIQYQYLGAGAIKIYFEKQNGDVVLVHTEKYAGLYVEPSVHNPNFHFHMHVDNKSTEENIIMKSSSHAYFIEGKTSFIELHQPENSSSVREKITVETEVAIFTIRNKASYASKVNFIDILLLNVSAAIEANSANNIGNIKITKNTTLGGTPAYSDINTSDSVIEIDTAGTTLTGGKVLFADLLAGKNDKLSKKLSDLKIILSPGESITISGTSANSATMDAIITWRELF